MSEETSQTIDTSSADNTTEATNTEATVTDNGVVVSDTSYMDGKFTSISAFEDSHRELQKTFSQKTAEYKEKLGAFTGSPEAYELPEGIEVSDTVQKYAMENQFSNDALIGLAEAHNQAQAQAQEAYLAEQRELLGTDADTRLGNVNDWVRANLGEEALVEIGNMISSAKGVEILEQIAKLNSGTAPAQVQAPKTIVDRDTVRDMRFATDPYGNRKMSSDPQYRAKVEAMERELINNGGHIN